MSYTHPKFPSGYATIRVTQEDIDNGERQSSAMCPVALAIRRELEVPVNVMSCFVILFRDGVGDTTLPKEVMDFICDFDSGDPVQPFEFQIPWRPRVPRPE